MQGAAGNMAFEHYTRSGTKMLRCGYTTGTCAALAAAAATRILLTGRAPETVSLMTAKGILVEVAVDECGAERTDGETVDHTAGETKTEGLDGAELTSAWAAIPKDAGDDADVTDGLLIRADVTKADTPGIHIDGGRGVGRVTKPGLDQPVGNAAINSGPRRMIEAAVRAACEELGYDPDEMGPGAVCEAPETDRQNGGGLNVVVSVPEGEAAAKKSFNPKLGIEGGISILGTSGIVEPMSEQALVDTIEVELKQVAVDSKELILTPGNYGSDYIAGHDLDSLGIPVLKFSNFLGETLDMITGTQVETVLLVSHVGKLSKVAAGIMNTHSKYADGRNDIFCAHAAVCGGSTSLCRELMGAATTDACIELLEGEHLREHVIRSILQAVQAKLEHRVAGKYRIGALMFSNVYGLLGMTETGEAILREWESRED
jgi:cobalt-precorrin-5B (C1)-methyltransferase